MCTYFYALSFTAMTKTFLVFLVLFVPVVQVRIDQPEYVIQENQGPLSVCTTLIEANIERNLVVILSTSDGTAQGKSHFQFLR